MCIERPARSPRYQIFDNLTGWILIEIRGGGRGSEGAVYCDRFGRVHVEKIPS